MGHTHREVPGVVANGVLLAQANLWGRHLARADLYLEQDDVPALAASWPDRPRTIPVTPTLRLMPRSPRWPAAATTAETREWLTRVIGESAAELTAADARVRDTAILDLVQRVQLEAGHADVSMVASFNPQARIAGRVP